MTRPITSFTGQWADPPLKEASAPEALELVHRLAIDAAVSTGGQS